MRLYVGVTDKTWFENLARENPPVAEVNFWQPTASRSFRAIDPGSPFLFKLKAPINKICGVGFFYLYRRMPIRDAWETFKLSNGRNSYELMVQIISRYRGEIVRGTDEIGCIVLEQPVFFPQESWIDVPSDWSDNIVTGKTYETETPIGRALWTRVQALLQAGIGKSSVADVRTAVPEVFGTAYLRKSRPGQGAFRIALTDAYAGHCAITGESTLPVLEAAHILPVSSQGTNEITNGLLLRSDMHILYDDGLIGVTPDYAVQVSEQIRERYVNGKVYYRWHGERLSTLPKDESLYPDREKLEWHIQNVFER